MMKDNILKRAKDTLISESETLLKVGDSLDEQFTEVIELLSNTKGRIILTGIGKNQFIGQKIAATLNSIGHPSHFMHAGDAIHGDLGAVLPNDVILCLSKSGNSPEIKVLIPLIRSLKVTLIALTSVSDSYLARQSDWCILIPVEHESCPHNLTPTNSTTAYLAIGDAIAMCLLSIKNFSPEDFARFHPGGSLGKKLFLRVDDLYRVNERPLVNLDTPLHETIVEISKKRLGATVVMHNKQIAGIITDGDLRRLLEQHTDLAGLCAKDALSANPKTISADSLAFEALNLMRANNITQLIVTANESYLGIIHIHDILKEGII